ncbi:MAG: DUF1934 domain-containing protein [Clostridia bacterium]|nr:DUF1934 domain-containing protein [Clostridia bacterium]MBP3938602.1 DUF1934 domain-containing protein [Clostridia bacterium]
MNCLITIHDYHDVQGQREKSELTTTAEIFGTADDYSVIYKEQSEELMGCTTTIRVENSNRVTVSRKGAYNTELKMEKGKRNLCCYNTPVGQIMMGVFTSSVRSEFKENEKIVLDFSYSLDFNNELLNKNRIKITANFKEVS